MRPQDQRNAIGSDSLDELVIYETFFDELSNTGICPECKEDELHITFLYRVENFYECDDCGFKCKLEQIKN